MGASALLVTQKIVALSKPTANAFFIDNVFNPAISEDEIIKDDFSQLQRIDFNGMLFNIYLNELMKAAATIEGQVPDPCLKAESAELLRFLYRIANREHDEQIELTYLGIYFKIGILLAANDETLNKNGWSGHFHYAKNLLDQGCNTIYVFGIGKKANVASKIAYAVKDSDDRIVIRFIESPTAFCPPPVIASSALSGEKTAKTTRDIKNIKVKITFTIQVMIKIAFLCFTFS